MSSAPVGIREIVAAPPPTTLQLAWQRRIAFAIALIVGSVVVVGFEEAIRWHRTIDVGLELSPNSDCIVSVTPGGLADRAGLKPAVLVFMRDANLVELDGSVHARAGLQQLRVRVRPFSDEVTDCHDYWPMTEPPSSGDDIVIALEGPPSLARDPSRPWHALSTLPFIVLFALLVGQLARLTTWRRDDVEFQQHLRLYSFVLPAVATALLVPLSMHLSIMTVLHDARDGERFLYAVASTVPAWIALTVIAAKDAAHHAAGDFKTSSWRWMTVPILPAALLVVPGILVMITSFIVLRVLRRHHKRLLAREGSITRSRG